MRLLITLLLAISLSGCGLFTRKVEIRETIKYEYIKYNVPKLLLENCKATPPVSKIDFISMGTEEREAYLTDYAITLLSDIKLCDNKISGIKDYIDKREKINIK